MTDPYEVVWGRSALRDLDEILEHIATDVNRGVDQALSTYEKVRSRVSTLKRYPRRCRRVPELDRLGLREFRELIVNPFRIVFRLTEGEVRLIGVLDSRRDLEELLVYRALVNPSQM